MAPEMVTIYNATNGHIDGAPDGEYCRWSSYCDCDDVRIAALDALQEMCRMTCDYAHGYYSTIGSRWRHRALDTLVKAGRLEWINTGPDERMAKDKEA